MASDESERHRLAHTLTLPGGPPSTDGEATHPFPPPPTPAVAEHELPPRTLGRYRLTARLGAGAMGVVWEALDTRLDRRIAIKVVSPALARVPDAAARLMREAIAMAKVSHRAVVAVHDAGEAGGELFIAMELVVGTTLGRLLDGRRGAAGRDWRRWSAMMLEAGRGLAAAHAAGVVHRDFKPDNILVAASSGQVCVGDFGVAQLSARDAPATRASRPALDRGDPSPAISAAEGLTTTGALIGTPAYMAPEQLRGDLADARTDQFAFCVTVFEALHGVRPFAPPPGEEPLLGLLEEIEAGRIHAVRDSRIPRRMRDAIERGLSADPAKRWPSMTALLAELAPRRLLRFWLGGAAIAVLAAAVFATAVLSRSSHQVTTRPLGETSMRNFVTVDATGTRAAIANPQLLEVRSLDDKRRWRLDHPNNVQIGFVEFVDPDHLRIGANESARGQLLTWDLTTDEIVTVAVLEPSWSWLGTVEGGHLEVSGDPGGGFHLRSRLDDGDHLLGTGTVRFEHSSISPDRKLVAYAAPDTYGGAIVVVDVHGHEVARTPSVVELSGLGWRDDDHLVYSTGISVQPTIYDVELRDRQLGTPRIWYREPHGWFGPLAAGGGRLVFVDNKNSFRAKLFTSDVGVIDLEPEQYGAGIGWTADDRWVSWNRNTGTLELAGVPRADGMFATRGPGGPQIALVPTPTVALIDGEPANATMAGDLVILAMRKPGGRELVAVSLSTGVVAWRKPIGFAALARCADDAAPPCFAVVEMPEAVTVRRLDPVTAELGEVVYPNGGVIHRISDIAVAPGGNELVVATAAVQRVVLSPFHESVVDIQPLGTSRGLAYSGDHVLVAGNEGTSLFSVADVDLVHPADNKVLFRSSRELLFQPRPSRDRKHVLVMGRVFEPELRELVRD